MNERTYNTRIKAIFVLTVTLLIISLPAAAGAQGSSISFTADRRVIQAGECVNIGWDVRNVNQVYYNGAPVAGENQTRSECPGQTKTYYLEVLENNGQVVTVPLTIWVQGGTPVPVIRFWADRYTIKRGECVNISWHVENVREVYYKGRGVVGENQNRVECPSKSRIYDLIVVKTDGSPQLATVTINVQR